MKYLLCIMVLSGCFIYSCKSPTTKTQDNPAYHNPTVQALTDSIAQTPSNPNYYYQRSIALAQINEDSLALLDLQSALKLSPNNLEYINSIGFVELNLNRPNDAIKTFQKSLSLQPNNANIEFALSKAYIAANQLNDAMKMVDSITHKYPKADEALLVKAQLQAAQKDTTQAINTLKNILMINPKNYDASLQLADWYNAQNATMTVEQYLYTFTLDSTDATPLFEIGKYYQKSKQLEKAKYYYEQCFLTDRHYTYAYIYSAEILMTQDSLAKAQRLLNIARSIEINNADAWYETGECFSKLHNADSAKYYFIQAGNLGYDLSIIKQKINSLK